MYCIIYLRTLYCSDEFSLRRSSFLKLEVSGLLFIYWFCTNLDKNTGIFKRQTLDKEFEKVCGEDRDKQVIINVSRNAELTSSA